MTQKTQSVSTSVRPQRAQRCLVQKKKCIPINVPVQPDFCMHRKTLRQWQRSVVRWEPLLTVNGTSPSVPPPRNPSSLCTSCPPASSFAQVSAILLCFLQHVNQMSLSRKSCERTSFPRQFHSLHCQCDVPFTPFTIITLSWPISSVHHFQIIFVFFFSFKCSTNKFTLPKTALMKSRCASSLPTAFWLSILPPLPL